LPTTFTPSVFKKKIIAISLKKRIKEMINHLFKLIWKRRKSNFLIMLEIFVAFMILFAVSSASIYLYRNYNQPSGINVDNVWTVYVNYNSFSDSLNRQNGELLEQKLKSFKEIQAFSFGHETFPYGNSHSRGDVSVNGQEANNCSFVTMDEHAPAVLKLELAEGTWFKNSDTVGNVTPVIITQCLKEKLFGNENAIGKKLGEDKDEHRRKVVGVIRNFKQFSDYDELSSTMLLPFKDAKTSFMVRVAPSVASSLAMTNADFEAQFAKSLRQLNPTWNIEILHTSDMKADKNMMYTIPLVLIFIVSGFLIVNVILGLFGVLFQNISRRKGEIGIRRAMGATQVSILSHFVGEMVVLATFSIGLGVFFAIQFPILKVFDVAASVYISGILLAILAVYLLVILCAWLPSRQAAAIHPAMALHDE
jgi:putative ABC transport system permease protein